MRLLAATNLLFCVAAIAFPFSVAATNIALGGALAIGIVSGLWWLGAKVCWSEFRQLSIVFFAYFLLLLLGLIWSHDVQWGVHILGRQWFWLLVPILVASLAEERWRRYFLFSLSTGLTLHLLYCVLQSYGYVHSSTDGSNADNATGHIGHIGFGVVYGIWAAWLVFLGWDSNGWQRWIFWSLAGWAYVMIFAAQGRSGYIVAFVLVLAVAAKCFKGRGRWKRIGLFFAGSLIVFSLAMALGPAKERLQGTWMAMMGEQHDTANHWQDYAAKASTDRVEMWKTSLDIYMENPVFGVGTGGFPKAVDKMIAQGNSASKPTSHPHNQYLLALARWGPLGLILLCTLLYVWMREGWRMDWHKSPVAPLVFLPPLALAIHALSSTSVEEHFSAILAVLLLGTGLSGNRDHNKAGGE